MGCTSGAVYVLENVVHNVVRRLGRYIHPNCTVTTEQILESNVVDKEFTSMQVVLLLTFGVAVTKMEVMRIDGLKL